MSTEKVNGLLGPDFYFRVKCMYDMLAMRQGVDPDSPPKSEVTEEEKPKARKLSGTAAAAALQELATIKERANKEG